MSTLNFKSKRFQHFYHPRGACQGPRRTAGSLSAQGDGKSGLSNRLLCGEDMPDFETLACHVLQVSSRLLPELKPAESVAGLVAESPQGRVYLIYRPNRSWLRSERAALNVQRAAKIAEANVNNRPCIVFAAVGFMSRKALMAKNIEFRQLPFALQQAPDARQNQVETFLENILDKLLQKSFGRVTSSRTSLLHRDGQGWREFDYQRDILPYLDWPSLHCHQPTVLALIPSPDTVLADTVLDTPCLVQQLLDLVPNPWQCIRLLEEAMAMLSERGFTEAQLFRARPSLLQAMRSDLQQQIAAGIESLFRRKLALGEIKEENGQ